MARPLRHATAVTVTIGPFVDNADGFTEEGGLTIAQADVRLSKNGAAWAQKGETTSATHQENGYYSCLLNATDTGTLGLLRLAVDETGALPIFEDFMVMPASVYDAMFGGTIDFPLQSPNVSEPLSQKFDTDTTAHAVTMPATVHSGDLLIVSFCHDGGTTVATPSGWTLLQSDLNGTALRLATFAKLAVGTEGGTTVDFVTGAVEQATAIVYRVSAGTFFPSLTTTGIVIATAQGNGTTADPPNVTIPWGTINSLVIAVYGADDIAAATAFPTNYAQGAGIAGANATGTTIWAATRVISALSENPGTFTIPTQEYVAHTIVIRPMPEANVAYWRGEAIPATSAAGTPKVDPTHWLGTALATPTVAGVPEVDTTHFGGTVAPTPAVAGIPKAELGAIGADAISAATFAADTGMKPILTGTAQTGSGHNWIKLASGASAVHDLYVPCAVRITGGTGVGQPPRLGTAYNGTNKQLIVSPPWEVIPDNTTTYALLAAPAITHTSERRSMVLEQVATWQASGAGGSGALFLKKKGLLFINNGGAAGTNALFRFLTPSTDLTNFDQATFANDTFHDTNRKMTYSDPDEGGDGYIYCLFHNTEGTYISQVDPDTLAVVNVVSDTTETNPGGSIYALGGSLYVLTQDATSSVVIKYTLGTGPPFTRADSEVLTSLPFGRALYASSDKQWLLATNGPNGGSNGWIARINPSSLAYTSQSLNATGVNFTDSFAVVDGYAWLGASDGSIYKVDIATLSNFTIIRTRSTDPVNGLSYELGYIWAGDLSGTFNGVHRIDPRTHEVQTYDFEGAGGLLFYAWDRCVSDGQFIYAQGAGSIGKVARVRLDGSAPKAPTNFASMAITPSAGGGQVAVSNLDAIADEVWDEVIAFSGSNHATGATSSAGYLLHRGAVAQFTHYGVCQAATAGTITLDTGTSNTDDFYNDYRIITYPGGLLGAEPEVRRITDYVGSTRVATIDKNWLNTPVAGVTQFVIVEDAAVSAVTTALAQRLADELLKRDWSAVSGEAARSVLNALRLLRNKAAISGGTLTVKKEDDSTTAWTGATTGTPGLTEIDPA